jgi:histone acetyltransferase (RNA polymerase elongator complex component)
MRLSSVVLPLPRKPVRIVTGIMVVACFVRESECLCRTPEMWAAPFELIGY